LRSVKTERLSALVGTPLEPQIQMKLGRLRDVAEEFFLVLRA
jgi:hypothetical protein